jgi:hypothetical protein
MMNKQLNEGENQVLWEGIMICSQEADFAEWNQVLQDELRCHGKKSHFIYNNEGLQ